MALGCDSCLIGDIFVGVGAVAGLLYLANRLFFSGSMCTSKNRLDGKVAIITGANTGIGYETALDFAKRGARVILACRDTKKAEKAAEQIRQETGSKEVDSEYLDLADLDTVREFAKKMCAKLDRLDLLVNNAGIMMCPLWRTKQNFETQFGVNHIGHFVLTRALLDLMKKSGEPSRIVNLSSLAHTFSDIRWDDINWEKKDAYKPIAAYGQSKTANILFTNQLHKQLKDDTKISVFAVHPGSVRTELQRYTDESMFRYLSTILRIFWPLVVAFSKSPAEGAQTTIHCSVSDEALPFNGKYFSDCKPKKTSAYASDDEKAQRLWDISVKMVEESQK